MVIAYENTTWPPCVVSLKKKSSQKNDNFK